jgi:large conductance mechanosensitive channel
MPPRVNNNDSFESDDEDDTLLEHGARRARRVVNGFVDFAFQGNVLEIAFGLM